MFCRRLVLIVSVFLPLTCLVRAEDHDLAVALASSAEKSNKSGDFATAKDMSERALNADKNFGPAHFQLAQALEGLNQPREAIRSYLTAADLAKKDKDNAQANKALDAAKRLGPGLMELGKLDQQYLDKFLALAEKAFAEGQLDTAKAAFAAVLALSPKHEKALQEMEETKKAIEARGDPVQAKIADAAMAEVWYNVGSGKKDEAKKLATELSQRFPNLPSGKEAARLVADNFAPPKDIQKEIEAAKKELAERQKKLAAAAAAATTTAPATTPSATTAAVVVKPVAPAGPSRLELLEKSADETVKKLTNDQLAAAFNEHLKKGKEFFGMSTPGSEGNQKNLALALEQFIISEAIFARMEPLKLVTDSIQAGEERASMLRYACMKMTILEH